MSETTYTPESGDVEALEFHVTEDNHPETGTLLGFWLYPVSYTHLTLPTIYSV